MERRKPVNNVLLPLPEAQGYSLYQGYKNMHSSSCFFNLYIKLLYSPPLVPVVLSHHANGMPAHNSLLL